MSSGSVFTIGSTNLTVSGATTDNGDIVYSNANGSKTFNAVAITASGTWDCSGVDMFFSITGNLANNGTFNASATTAGANEYKFTSATATITGNITIPHLNVSGGAVLTNTNTLTISDSLYGTGQYIQAAGSTLLYNSFCSITVSTFNASALNNMVDYDYAGAQTVLGGGAVNYYNLNCSTSGNKTMGNTITILNNLIVQGTALLDANIVKNCALSVAGNWTISSTNATPFLPEQGMVTFNGSAGVQAITTTVATGHSFYNVVFNNTSPSSPDITAGKEYYGDPQHDIHAG